MDIPKHSSQVSDNAKEKSRKKKIFLLLSICALLVVGIVVGIILITNSVRSADVEKAKKRFIPPAQAHKVDVDQSDPSDDKIAFTFDGRHRISSCSYKANNKEYKLDYDYDDDESQLIITTRYKTDVISITEIDYAVIPLPKAGAGNISVYRGYYVSKASFTAEDLITRSVPEIVRLMGGDFDCEQNKKDVYNTESGFYFYNDDTLPGFVFYVDETISEFSKLKKSEGEEKAAGIMKERILDGVYKKLEYIAVYDPARLNEKIAPSMTYREFISVYGHLKTTMIPGSDHPGHYIEDYHDANVDAVYVFYKKFDIDYTAYNATSDDVMKQNDPQIFSIIVIPR